MKTEVGKREQWTGEADNLAQGCPWSLPSQGPFPGVGVGGRVSLGPRIAGPSPRNQAGQKGGFTVLPGAGEGDREERTVSGSLPQLLGVGAGFGTVYLVSLEVEGGRGGGARDLGFFP